MIKIGNYQDFFEKWRKAEISFEEHHG